MVEPSILEILKGEKIMRIVVLDGYTLNPGDLSWREFELLGECVVYDRTSDEQVLARSAWADILLTNKTILARDTISKLPDLRYIGVLATGYNVVDIEAAAERKIPVTNVPEYGTSSVVQMVFAHLLNHCQHVADHSASVQRGTWSKSEDFCFWEHPLVELSGLTMGIVGLGRIGSAVAKVAQAFGMKVIAYAPTAGVTEKGGVLITDLPTLFRNSDVISLHCPLTEHTQGLVNEELLGVMKKNGFLINTSRGRLIEERALSKALNDGRIAGAGLDVLPVEPPPANSPLLTAKNCYVTPHIAWATHGARSRLIKVAAANLQAFVKGQTINVINVT